MFDTIVTKCIQPKSVEWEAPNKLVMEIKGEDKVEVYTLLKGAEDFLHKQIDVKVGTSKELYKKEQSIWKQFKDIQLDKCKDKPNLQDVFTLEGENVVYLVNDSKEVVDIMDFKDNSVLQNFIDLHQKYILDITTIEKTKKFFTDGKNGLVKLVCYDKNIDITQEEYVPVVILELNNNKSVYKVYSGIFMYDTFTFVPSISCDIEVNNLCRFITLFDMEESLKYAKDKSIDIYESYIRFKENPVEISVRELTNMLKKVGYKLELDDVDKLHPIENLNNEENNIKIQNFYNTFKDITGESALDILQLSELKKTFRYNKITLVELLSILSREYLEYNGSKITAEILGDIIFKLYNTKNIDKIQVESIKHEVNT